jgi:hypothetical protein
VGEAVQDINSENLEGININEYLKRLEEADMCLMVYRGDELIFQSSSKGVRPHLEAIVKLGDRLKGTVMVDKIVGRAAALLILYSEAVEVYAGVITSGGREVLTRAGVKLSFEVETEHIKMVDGRIYCPFEAMVQGIDDPLKAYTAIVEKMDALRKIG